MAKNDNFLGPAIIKLARSESVVSLASNLNENMDFLCHFLVRLALTLDIFGQEKKPNK